jgi:hypothetical protein
MLSGSGLGKWWIRNYAKLFQSEGYKVTTTKILPEIWGGNWGKFGYIIEIRTSLLLA